MHDFTVKDIIKIVPLEEALRKELLANFDSYPQAQKFDIESSLWNAFTELTEELKKIKFEEFVKEIALGKKNTRTDLMNEAEKEVYKDYEDILSGKMEEIQQIDSVREKLAELMQKKSDNPQEVN